MRKSWKEEHDPQDNCCDAPLLRRDPIEYFLVCHSCGAVQYGSNVNYSVEGMPPEDFWGSHVHRTPTLYDPFKYCIRRLDLVCGQNEFEVDIDDVRECKSWYANRKCPPSLKDTRHFIRSHAEMRKYTTCAAKFHHHVIGEACGIVTLPQEVRELILNGMKVYNYENHCEKWTKKAINVDFLARKLIVLYHEKHPEKQYNRCLKLFKSGIGKKALARNEHLWNLCKDIITKTLNL